MAVATSQDVQASLLRELNPQENEYVERLLERAETLLRVRISDLDDRVELDSHFSNLVAQIEAEAVARVFRAGESGSGIYSSESEDGYSYRLNFKVASGFLDILPEEWARIFGSGGFRTVAPQTDGYARTRYPVRPDLHFQYGWGGGDQLAERLN